MRAWLPVDVARPQAVCEERRSGDGLLHLAVVRRRVWWTWLAMLRVVVAFDDEREDVVGGFVVTGGVVWSMWHWWYGVDGYLLKAHCFRL